MTNPYDPQAQTQQYSGYPGATSNPYGVADGQGPGYPYQPPAYPNPSYGAPYTPPPRKDRSGMRKWGKALTIVGALILVATVVIGIILAASGFGDLVEGATDLKPVNPVAQVDVAEGDALQLYAPTDATDASTCLISGPGNPTRISSSSTTITFDGRELTSVATYTFDTAGRYTALCPPTVDGVYLGPPLSVSSILSGVGGVALAFIGGGTGVLILLIGVVLWAIAGRKPR